jgi:hypothetical protein
MKRKTKQISKRKVMKMKQDERRNMDTKWEAE